MQVEQLNVINFLYGYAYQLFESGIYNIIILIENNYNLENFIQKLIKYTANNYWTFESYIFTINIY